MRRFFLIWIWIVLHSACNRQTDEVRNPETPTRNNHTGLGRVIPVSDCSPPLTIPLDPKKLASTEAGKPSASSGFSNISPCENLPVVVAALPKIRVPGKDGFSIPASSLLHLSPLAASEPEISPAGNMGARDQNPASFSYFGKLQGLHLLIKCIMEDHRGNLWFGTLGGGLTRYDGRNFFHFNEKSGLLNNRIQCLLEDRRGNIWIGTDGNGAVMYDGKRFFNFSKENGFPSHIVQSIAEDKKGDIWFGTDTGAVRYDGKFITHFTENEGLGNNIINCILPDRNGNVWFGTDGGGVSCYKDRRFLNFTEKEGLSSNFILSLLEDRKGEIWMGTADKGACKFDGNSFSSLGIKEGLSGDKVWSICKDSSGSLWFGTEGGGLTRYDGIYCARFLEKEGLSNNEVHDIHQDRHGNLWIATFGGVNLYNGNSFSHFTVREGLGNNRVMGILQDHSGLLWFGTAGGGLSRFDGKQFLRYTDAEGLPDNNITCLLEDRHKTIWIGTEGAGLVRFENGRFSTITTESGLLNNSINCLTEDSEGNLWIGTFGGGASRFDGKSLTNFIMEDGGMSSNEVNCILYDKIGTLWFGTSEGITRFDGSAFTQYKEKDGLCKNEVFSLLEDNEGNIWAGTAGGGISVLHKEKLHTIGKPAGLSNNFVLSLMEDKSGGIWAGTRNGLNRLNFKGSINEKILQNPGEHLFLNYAYEEGFLAIGCNMNAIHEDKTGTIWVGGNDKLTAVKPSELMGDLLAPVMELSSIDLFNEKLNWSFIKGNRDSIMVLKSGIRLNNIRFDSLSRWNLIPENLCLAHNNNNISFNFTGITCNRPKKIKYEYQLSGFDENWNSPSSSPVASYSNLPFGDYVFRAKAMNSHGIWSKEIKYAFSIRPPWWRTWWAYGSYVLLAFSCFIGFIKWRERSLKNRQKQLETEIGRATLEIRNQNEVIEEERKRSDALLTNILPQKIAEELKVKGTADARLHESVSVLFTDFSNFTGIAAGMSPAELVKDLHECFSEFDSIVQKYGLEKIKIIGDSYMAACGIPDERPAHARECTLAAIEIQAYFQARRKEIMDAGSPYYDLRIGIHSGPVVAGVVGARKFQYDIWGDTVNTASRMESSGVPGRINISEETYLLVKDQFECEYRGELEAKGKGKIRMYFVNAERQQT